MPGGLPPPLLPPLPPPHPPLPPLLPSPLSSPLSPLPPTAHPHPAPNRPTSCCPNFWRPGQGYNQRPQGLRSVWGAFSGRAPRRVLGEQGVHGPQVGAGSSPAAWWSAVPQPPAQGSHLRPGGAEPAHEAGAPRMPLSSPLPCPLSSFFFSCHTDPNRGFLSIDPTPNHRILGPFSCVSDIAFCQAAS